MNDNLKWYKFSELWKKIEYPWRPAKSSLLSFYEKRINDYKKESNKSDVKVLIFGCTPELRDLCSKLKLNVTLFDFNEAMYNSMNILMKRKPYDEKLVLGKWEEVAKHFKKDQFDIIFGDLIHGNFSIDFWDKNYKEIKDILKKDGIYFLSEWSIDFETSITFNETMKLYRKNKKYFSDFRNKMLVFHQLMLGEKCYDYKNQTASYAQLRKKFKEYAKKQNISLEILKNIWILDEDMENEVLGNYFDYAARRSDIIEFIVPYFWIDKVIVDKTHPVMKFRLDMVLRPKKDI